ncbi:ATP-binding protein [uncultured Aquincola sp.]|uniref:ATP-binding protein n=1 Tax=uncultured Aquincola sp. TaxID=886556 RepID=UPI0032B2D63B|tara:strand:- start:1902 stop:4214 length:2313 start_codon:yes stop_codon:yes gene_type:complete
MVPSSLAARYALMVGGLSIGLLLTAGGLHTWMAYRQARTAIAELQRVHTEAAAQEIAQALRRTENTLRDAAKMPWERNGFGVDALREELARLLVLAPAVLDVRHASLQPDFAVFVSRADRQAPGAAPTDCPADTHYGNTRYEAGVPLLELSVPTHRPGSCLMATLNLRFLADVVSGLRIGEHGQVYVVDAADHLIAHPRPTHALRQLSLGNYGPVAAARSASPDQRWPVNGMDAVDVDGLPVIVTAAPIPGPRWLVLAQQPRSEALRPVVTSVAQTLALVLLAGLMAAMASLWFSRRMAAPIVALRRATARIAGGNLASGVDAAIDARGGAELTALAQDFNEMAHQLQASYRGLEAKVAERTAELSAARDLLLQQSQDLARLNEQLRAQLQALAVSQEQAVRASAAKTRFLAAASHDLRQPMHSVSLLMSVLRERLQQPEQVSLADKVSRSIGAMEHLFSGLLDISRLDAGDVRAQPGPQLLDDMLARVLCSYEPQAAAKGLRLQLRAPRGVLVRTDAAMLERVLGNLVANAVRYTASGGVLMAARPRGAEVLVQVIDTGPGIPAAHLDDVFEEFFRLDSGSGHPGGLGLGLSIVKRSLAMLGHPLQVRSRVGHGTSFGLLLPRVAGWPLLTDTTGVQPVDDGRLTGCFVLLVDDDADNRDALRALCLQWGCLVADASSGEAALAEVDRHLRTPDLIITDQSLGNGWTGTTLVTELRRRLDDQLPAVVLTADLSPETDAQIADIQAVKLSKPASAQRLRQAAIGSLARVA